MATTKMDADIVLTKNIIPYFANYSNCSIKLILTEVGKNGEFKFIKLTLDLVLVMPLPGANDSVAFLEG